MEKNDRAALINLGSDEVWTAKFIRYTKLVSPRSIWDAGMQQASRSRFPNLGKRPPKNLCRSNRTIRCHQPRKKQTCRVRQRANLRRKSAIRCQFDHGLTAAVEGILSRLMKVKTQQKMKLKLLVHKTTLPVKSPPSTRLPHAKTARKSVGVIARSAAGRAALSIY